MGFQGIGEGECSKHKRSKSVPDKKGVGEDGLATNLEASNCINLGMRHLKDSVKTKKQQSPTPGTEVQSSLKQEISQLEKRLQDQFEVRRALETALGYRTSSHHDVNEALVSISKPATELVKEIAVLELEVVYLEQYLLSLYREAFDQNVSSLSPKSRFSKVSRPDNESKVEFSAILSGNRDNSQEEPNGIEEELLDSSVHQCHSSLSQPAMFSGRTPDETLLKAACARNSHPSSVMEYPQDAPNIISLAEHLGTRISDHVPETPNKLSQDMIKCMSAIYCKLADPPLIQNSCSSPNSPMSSANAFSPQDQHETWSPGFRNNSSFERLDNPFHVEGFKEFSGPYSTMVEVPWIFRDCRKLGDVEHLLQNYWSLVSRLEEVDPRKLKHEEKLAFWINIHNSLVMHAFLAHGIPQNNVKRFFLLLRAAYNIGGHTISADTIQSSILGCRMSRPGKWLRLLLPSKAKFKPGDERQAYAIEHPEPLLHFALCSGNHSDPAIRAYTSKRVIQELETAKEEYIRAAFGVRKDKKILLPKIVESFAKESSLCQAGVIEMIQQSLPESLCRSIRRCRKAKSRKSIEWIPRNFTFRYLICKEIVR